MLNALRNWIARFSVTQTLLRIERIITMNQAELVSHLNALTGAVDGIGTEITTLQGEVASLRTALDAAGNLTPEAEAALVAVESRVAAVGALAPVASAPAA